MESYFQVKEAHALPWLLIRDFNEVLLSEERNGAAAIGGSKKSGTVDYVHREYIDLIYFGSRVTRTNSRDDLEPIQKGKLVFCVVPRRAKY